jgi:hypothetical protein
VGWLWFLIVMLPTIGLVQIEMFALADRYAYTAFIGLFIMVCWGVADGAESLHVPRFAIPAVSLAVLRRPHTPAGRLLERRYNLVDALVECHASELGSGLSFRC